MTPTAPAPAARGQEASTGLLRRCDVPLMPDPRRVAGRLFLPGQELDGAGGSRAAGVVARCSEMTPAEVAETMERVVEHYRLRHRDLDGLLEAHFAAIAHRVPQAAAVPPERRRLIGAYFTREVAVESAALFNPSVVAHPVQDAGAGRLRFVMSARAVGEGHLSTIVFRSGTFTARQDTAGVRMDPRSTLVECADRRVPPLPREQLRRQATQDGADAETLDVVLADLPDTVDVDELAAAVDVLRRERLTRSDVETTIAALRRCVRLTYDVTFHSASALSERTLFPECDPESHGMEDARFVRFVEDDGASSYLATYTGFDGSQVVSRRLDTADFRTFRSAPLTGRAAENKGMAVFPRRIGGRYLALSRWDRENNAVAASDDGYHWEDAVELQTPSQTWELIQLGNCGPPMETEAGWLVLTHGVGPMRAYALGALLLDLDDPARVIGRLTEPLLEPDASERDGYVPNVVYSCGGLVHDEKLLLPYGCSDTSIRFAVADLPAVLERLAGR
ncbi:MAG: glycosidase-like protein [Kineosporiaceae bacterium]